MILLDADLEVLLPHEAKILFDLRNRIRGQPFMRVTVAGTLWFITADDRWISWPVDSWAEDWGASEGPGRCLTPNIAFTNDSNQLATR